MTNPAVILEAMIFLTDQLWKINEKLERIGAQEAEETKQKNAELTALRKKLVREVTTDGNP